MKLHKMEWYKWLLAFLLLPLLTGCVETLTKMTTTVAASTGVISSDTAESINRTSEKIGKATEEITPEQEYFIGRAVAAEVIARYGVYDNPKANRYLNELGQTLAVFSDRPYTFAGYHFLIIDSDEINGFASPGGHIFITRGLLRLCDSEEAVAGVLAHEVAHTAGEHGLEAIKASRWSAVGSTLAAEVAKGDDADLGLLVSNFQDVIGDVVSDLINTGYSRELEQEADQGAVELLKRLGYSSDGYMRMLVKMQTMTRRESAGFFATHPDPADRIENVLPAIKSYRGTSPNNTRIARFQSALEGV
jgi:predicted Zn-dependent protease